MKHITFRHTLIISFILHVLMIGAFFMSHFLHTYIPRLTPQQLHNPDEKSDPRKDTETALPIDEESALSFSFQDGDIQDTIGTPQENNTASEVIEEKKPLRVNHTQHHSLFHNKFLIQQKNSSTNTVTRKPSWFKVAKNKPFKNILLT